MTRRELADKFGRASRAASGWTTLVVILTFACLGLTVSPFELRAQEVVAPAIEPIPKSLVAALEQVGFGDAAIVSIARPDGEPQTFYNPELAALGSGDVTIPLNGIKIGDENLDNIRRVTVILIGSAKAYDCKKQGGSWVCKTVSN